MRKSLLMLFLVLSSTLLFGQNYPMSIFEMDSNKKIVRSNSLFRAPNYSRPYLLFDSVAVRVGNTNYRVRVGNTDHSAKHDYDVIDIAKGGKSIYPYLDDNNLLKLKGGENPNMVPDVMLKLAKNNYFLEVSLTNASKALIFISPVYGGQLSILTIFILTEEDVLAVFNRELEPTSIVNTSEKFEMILVDTYPSEGLGIEDMDPAFRIYREGGKLLIDKI